ncbi:hypothetical protein RU96_GL001574 [Enterococcus canintestini]|uniref:Uncharacterized protein n=1 Tax=Enterococcus canintestini TaxID=317010 RepID=A0A1L8R8K7_9ENTE|nr:hypothetical protein RU96_GL001574 [Enterococcus canintestini]
MNKNKLIQFKKPTIHSIVAWMLTIINNKENKEKTFFENKITYF